MSFQVLMRKRELVASTFNVSVSLSHGAMGWSVVHG